jgi:hypothetical protein
MSKNKSPKILSFREAVLETEDVKQCYQVGLRGFGKYSDKVELKENKLCGGSLDIDVCTKNKYPRENRWDHALDYDGKTYFVEVHPANTGDVKTVIKKLEWLKTWLNEEAPEINKLRANNPYRWVQSGKFAISPNTPQYKEAAQNGILPKPKLKLGFDTEGGKKKKK